MFNLNDAINEWRQQMAAGGVKNSTVLDELESHLREDVDRQMRSGTDAQKAFHAAVQNIGPASALQNEFKKSVASVVAEKLMLAAAVLFLAFGAFLSLVTLWLCYHTMTERAMGFLMISLSFGAICFWPAFVSRLPVVQPRRKLLAMQVTCLAAGFAVSTFYVQVILPHFARGMDGLIPAIGFFACFPIAVGFSVAAGLDRAARRDSNEIMA